MLQLSANLQPELERLMESNQRLRESLAEQRRFYDDKLENEKALRKQDAADASERQSQKTAMHHWATIQHSPAPI